MLIGGGGLDFGSNFVPMQSLSGAGGHSYALASGNAFSFQAPTPIKAEGLWGTPAPAPGTVNPGAGTSYTFGNPARSHDPSAPVFNPPPIGQDIFPSYDALEAFTPPPPAGMPADQMPAYGAGQWDWMFSVGN